MVELHNLPDWQAVIGERNHLGSLTWAHRAPLRIKTQRSITEPTAAWLISPGDQTLTPELASGLRALDYLSESGEATDAANWAHAALHPRNRTSMRLFTRDHGGKRALIIGFDHEQALVLSNEGTPEWGLSYTTTELLPELIARWLPLTPALSFDIVNRTITDDELEAAVLRERHEDSPDAQYVDALLQLPWMQWMVQIGVAELTEFVTVPDWGSFRLNRTEETIELIPILSSELTVLFIESLLGTLDFAADRL